MQKRMEMRNYKYLSKRHPELITIEQNASQRVPVSEDEIELNNHFIDSDSNYSLATHIVYTNGANVDEVARSIADVYYDRPLSSDKVKIIENPSRIITHGQNKTSHRNTPSDSR